MPCFSHAGKLQAVHKKWMADNEPTETETKEDSAEPSDEEHDEEEAEDEDDEEDFPLTTLTPAGGPSSRTKSEPAAAVVVQEEEDVLLLPAPASAAPKTSPSNTKTGVTKPVKKSVSKELPAAAALPGGKRDRGEVVEEDALGISSKKKKRSRLSRGEVDAELEPADEPEGKKAKLKLGVTGYFFINVDLFLFDCININAIDILTVMCAF
jgi:hypothetical protein